MALEPSPHGNETQVQPRRSEFALTIPPATVILVLAVLLAVKVAALIAPLFFPVFFGVLLAIALTPCVHWLEQRGCARMLAIGFIGLTLSALMVVIVAAIVPPLYQQVSGFVHHLPELREKFLGRLPQDAAIRGYIERIMGDKQLSVQITSVREILGAGNAILGGLAEIVLVFVFTMYFMIDGPRAWTWLKAFFVPDTQRKLQQSGNEARPIIISYLAGQLITSLLSFVFVFAAMSLLKIPNALLGATLAFVFDILPVLGFFLSSVPVMIFATSVSPQMPFVVLALFALYHALENYLIVPLVYGNTLRVQGLVVFFGLLAAGLLGGIEGAIAVLPVIASYPILERIWLKRYLSPQALEVHRALNAK